MKSKIAIATCNGMSPNGLIGRVTVSDLTKEDFNLISICMGATSADNENLLNIITKFPIIAINGCSGNCVNKILKSKGTGVAETLNIEDVLANKNYKFQDVARLDEEGEKAVKEVKKEVKKIVSNLS